MALVSLMPYIDNRSSEPWSPLRSTVDMAQYIDQISGVFENPSIQQIPGLDSKAIWDTRTTYDFPNNVIEEDELYPRKKRKLPKSIQSLDPDSPSTDKLFENYHKDVWTSAPCGLRRHGQDPWKRAASLQQRQAEDLREIGQVSRQASDVPSLTETSNTSRPSLTVETPVSITLDTLHPHIVTSGYQDTNTEDTIEHLDWWMGTQTSLDSSLELEAPSTESHIPTVKEPGLGPPRRSRTMPVAGAPQKIKKPRQLRKRDSWPAPVVALRRPAFPRKKLQELQTTATTREEFRMSLSVTEEEKRARSKHILSLLLPLVKPKEAILFFPLFTKREVTLLTELLEEDKKLATKLEKVGITLPLNREKILQMAAARTQAQDKEDGSSVSSDEDGSRLSIEAVSLSSSMMESPSSLGKHKSLEEFPPDQEVDKEINKRLETPSHLLPNSKATDRNWIKIVKKLDDRFRYITWCEGVWTLELESFNTVDVPTIPLYIANSPVILSYAKPTPQISGQRPPDPLKDDPIPGGMIDSLSDKVLRILFRTFPKAIMVCVFLNRRMSIVYDHEFDEGIEHMTKPETFGGYRVSFMRNRPTFTASPPVSSNRNRLLTGKRVDVCRAGEDSGWTSCLGVRLRRKNPSPGSTEPNDVITMTTHAFLTALRLPSSSQGKLEEEEITQSQTSNASLVSTITDDDFARMKVMDWMSPENTHFGQYYHTYDDLQRLRGDIDASKFLYDLCLIKSLENAKKELPVISFQKKRLNQFKKMEWCTSTDMLKEKKGKMYLLNSWTGANSKNPKAGNIVAEGLVIGQAYQNIPHGEKHMYSRSILWRQNFTSKQWQVGQVQGLRERAYRVWNGAPVRRLRLEQHLTIQEQGYSGSPLAVKVDNSNHDEESYAIFGFQNYAMRCWRGDEDDGYKKSAFGDKKRGSVVNRVLMEALDHGAYEFFGSYKLPEKVIEDWDIIYDIEDPIPGITQTIEELDVSHKLVEGRMNRDIENSSDRGMSSFASGSSYIERSSRKIGTFRRGVRDRRDSSAARAAKCAIM